MKETIVAYGKYLVVSVLEADNSKYTHTGYTPVKYHQRDSQTGYAYYGCEIVNGFRILVRTSNLNNKKNTQKNVAMNVLNVHNSVSLSSDRTINKTFNAH